jgi:putative two-component system response regulator
MHARHGCGFASSGSMQLRDHYSTSSDVVSPQIPARSVLVVDDESAVRDLMSRWLESGGYAVATAGSAEEAVNLLETVPAAVALCDIRLPGHDGLWLADRIRHAFPETAVIMATGVRDVGPAVESLRHGVVDYLTKPFGRDRLTEAVWRGMEYHTAACASRRWLESLECDILARRARLADAILALRIDSDESLDAMLSMLTIHDRDTYAHAHRVAALSVSIARAMELSGRDVSTIQRGALLHDIGKLTIPESLLRKPAPLTTEEQRLIRLHPGVGSAILAQVPYLVEAAQVVRDAHERVDGLGFPRGKRGDEIWIGARIVSVANAYDTMTRPRAFRDASSPSDAMREIDLCSDTQFDRGVVDAFRRVLEAKS